MARTLPDSDAELMSILKVVERMAARMNAECVLDPQGVEAFSRVRGNFSADENASSHVGATRDREVA